MKGCKRVVSLILGVIFVLSSTGCLQKSRSISYKDANNWAYLGYGEDKLVDVFFIAPTVDMGEKGNNNISLDDSDMKEKIVGAINMERGIYEDDCKLYSPYYHQASYRVFSDLDREGSEYKQAIATAYSDVKEAFKYYLDNLNQGRPFILAGFSQGSLLGLELMKDFFESPKVNQKLVEAYMLGWTLTRQDVEKHPQLKLAKGEDDTGSIVTFNSESVDTKTSIIVPNKTLGINPLNWKTDDTYADKSLNKGACFTKFSGEIKREVNNLTGGYIDKERGTMKATDIDPKEYETSVAKDGFYHIYDFQFFYRNLQENVDKRVKAYVGKN